MERYVALAQFKARGAPDLCPVKQEWCKTACDKCSAGDGSKCNWSNSRSSWCDECNRCKAAATSDASYNDPYYHTIQHRTLAQTPALAKQFCDNVCGVNMGRDYRAQRDAYGMCLRVGSTGCERMYGCPNPNGRQFGYVAPIDPMYTDCKPCWVRK